VSLSAVGAGEFVLRYLEAPGAERSERPAAWPGLRPEGFCPVRGFRWSRGQRHMPGWWWSVTTGDHVGYEWLAGWRFMRVGVPDRVRTANITWLARYRYQRCGSPDAERLLLKVFADPVPLMAGAAAAGDPLAVLPALFHLMWRHVLVTDLDVRLTAGTMVTVSGRPSGGAG